MNGGADNNRGITANQLPAQMYPNPISLQSKNTGAGLLPTPGISTDLNHSDQDGSRYYESYIEEQLSKDHRLNSEEEQQSDDVIKTEEEFHGMEHSTTENEHSEEPLLKVPDFLPATQKALFMRIHGKKVAADQTKIEDENGMKRNGQDLWTYSSDEDEKSKTADSGVIKIDTESRVSSTATKSTPSAVESLLKMISKGGGNTANLDANLLSKVASVINLPNTSNDHYTPSSGVATYNPAQSKASPRRPSTTQHRERKDSGSITSSPVHPSKQQKPAPIRRRLSTQELTKEPVVIPLVAKQTNNQPMHSSHPDPRVTLSRLLGNIPARFIAQVPRFSKDLILPGSTQMVNMKVTVTTDDLKSSKRDPRLSRQKDPRLRSVDPRLKSRTVIKSTTVPASVEPKSSIPTKPSALLTKSATSIPSLPELDLKLALQQLSKENGDTQTVNSSKTTPTPTYSLPTLKLPRLVKAPNISSSPTRDASPVASTKEPTMPKIAPYDPRYMSSGPANTSEVPDLPVTPAPYDPRVLTGHPSLSSGTDIKKRTIQLPKLTPAPLYKPKDSLLSSDCPEGNQGDF